MDDDLTLTGDTNASEGGQQPTASGDGGGDIGDLVFYTEDGSQAPQGEQASGDQGGASDPNGQARQVPTLAELFGEAPGGQQQGAGQFPQQPPLPTGLPGFDQRFLDQSFVDLQEERTNLRYSQRLAQAKAGQAPVEELVNDAYQNSVALVRAQQKINQLMVALHGQWQTNQQYESQMEPVNKARTAQFLAERYGVAEWKNLLTHPVTNEPINDPRVMAAVASMMGDQKRQQAIQQRRGVDQPVAVTQGTSRTRSIQNLDPFGRDFERLEEQVRNSRSNGRTVHLRG